MVNKVILVGNVGADPDIRTFEDGSKVARVNLATTERLFNSKTQERSERTEWHRVVLWRGLAGVVEQYVRKGSQLYIEGRIRTNEWTDANGVRKFSTEIHADVMNMIGSRRDNSSQGAYNQMPMSNYNQSMQSGYNQAPQGAYNQAPQGSGYQDPQGDNFNQTSTPAPAPQAAPQPAPQQDFSEEVDDLPF